MCQLSLSVCVCHLAESDLSLPFQPGKQSLAGGRGGRKKKKWHQASGVRQAVTGEAAVLMCAASLWCIVRTGAANGKSVTAGARNKSNTEAPPSGRKCRHADSVSTRGSHVTWPAVLVAGQVPVVAA